MTWRKAIPVPQKGMKYPCVILEKDNWDDFNYKTSFRAAIYASRKERVHDGTVKFLKGDNLNVSLPEPGFEDLGDDYCSLWQSLNDYRVINDLSFGKDILTTMNDVVLSEIIRDRFESNPGMDNSLRRFSDAERAYVEGLKVLNNQTDRSSFSFRYIEGNESPTPFGTISFRFSRKLLGIYRTVGLIGRNGTGKTTLLANLATVLSGVKKSFAKLSPRPPISKVIAVSYSTFDDFYRPKKDERTFSYTYCGIRGQKDLLTRQEIEELFNSSYKRVVRKLREGLWEECMEMLYLNRLADFFPPEVEVSDSFKKLSSGQKIMTLSFTQIINAIDENSLLLFDEPENHLHPNGQNTLFKCLDFLLERFDSFAVISTHSPIFIQNIPQRNVHKLISINGIRSATSLSIESFGQHFSKLTEEIFGFSEKNLFYVEKLIQLIERKDEIGDDFDDLDNIESAGVRFNLNNLQ